MPSVTQSAKGAVLRSRSSERDCGQRSRGPSVCGPVAQLAEQQTLNLRVGGSIPPRLTNLRSRIVFLARATVGFAEGTEA